LNQIEFKGIQWEWSRTWHLWERKLIITYLEHARHLKIPAGI